MKITSSKPRGQKILSSKMKIKVPFGRHKGKKVRRPFALEPIGRGWWFDLSDGEWKPEYNGKGNMSSSYYAMTHDGFNNVWSLKAAKRKIANWDVPKGTWFRVSLPYVGYDFKIRKS